MAGYAGAGPPMRRLLIIVALFVLAGAVVNVGVAWGVFYLGFPSYTTDLGETEAADLLTSHTDISFVNAKGFEARSIGEWTVVLTGYGKRDGMVMVTAAVFLTESGWPLKTMHGRTLFGPGETPFHRMKRTSHSMMQTSGSDIPFLPIWPGFAVNTLFYAVVLWLLIPGPFALRRFIRVKRGLCPACAYPIGESAVCSECGKAIPSRKMVAT